MDKFISVKDIQAAFKLSKNSVYAVMHNPELHSFRMGKILYVAENDFLEWCRKQKPAK